MCGGSGFVDRLKDQRRVAHTREGFRATHRPTRVQPLGGLEAGSHITQLGANLLGAAGVGGETFDVQINRENAEEATAEAATASAADLAARGLTARADRERRRRLKRSSLLASGGTEATIGTTPGATPTYTLGG